MSIDPDPSRSIRQNPAPLLQGRSSAVKGEAGPGLSLAPVPWHRKVTTRFFLWLFLALSVAFSVLAYQIDHQEEKTALRALNLRLSSEGGVLMASLVRLLEKDDLQGVRSIFSSILHSSSDQAVLLGPDDQSVLLSSGPELPVPVSRLLSDRPGSGFLEGRDAAGRRVFLERLPLYSDASCPSCGSTRKRLGTLVLYSDGKDFARERHAGRWARFWMFSGILETLVLVVILLIRRSLVRPLDGLSRAIAQVGPDNPDLRLSFPRTKDDELGRLVYALNRFVDLFRGWMGEVSDRVRWVEAHADLLEKDHKRRYRKEEELRLTLNELRLRVRDLLNGKPQVPEGDVARSISWFSEKSRKISQVTLSVRESVREARSLSETLSVDGEGLEKMRRNLSLAFGTIGEIARELHLTGMNAAIEASHAGAGGRTFRIVADTVADLSRKTEEALSAIGSELSELNGRLDHVAAAFAGGSEGLETADRGLAGFQETWTLFQEALAKVELQWEGMAERIQSETEAILKIQTILDSLAEDFRGHLGQKPLEERHLGEILKVVKELNAEIDRFRV